jgi:hypothetical protein
MAVANGYGKVATSGSVFMYDVGDTRNSYRGEPTTNLLPNGVAEGHNSGGYGNVVTVTDATIEKGPGWKKVTISNRGSNFRIIQWTYIAMSANITYCHSAEFDWGNMRDKGYFIYFDGNGTGGRTYYRPGNYSSAGSEQINLTMPDGKFAGTILHTAAHTHAFFIGNYSTNVSGLNDYFYYKEFQVEINSHPTQYTTGTRSATQGLLALVGNSSIDLSNVSFDSNAQMTFDGTNDYIDLGYAPFSGTGDFTIDTVYTLNTTDTHTIIGNYPASSLQFMGSYGLYINGSCYFPSSLGPGTYHAAATRESGVCKLYLNGALVNTVSNGNSIGTNSFVMGKNTSGGEVLNGKVPIMKLYNRALSAAEVKQNYNKYKTRFNLP